MTGQQQRDKLHSEIWKIANDVRGAVDGWDFKQFVLGALFYRFISENFINYIEAGDDSINYAGMSDSALNNQGGRVTGRHTDPAMPGVETVTYQVAARDSAGNIIPGQFRTGQFKKTVYNPSVLSDQKVAQMSSQASQRATFSDNTTQTSVTVDGYKFQVYRNPKTGEITNAHLSH